MYLPESKCADHVLAQYGVEWAHLKALEPDLDDEFGFSVSLSGDRLAVGARYEDSNVTGIDGDASNNSLPESGAAYVFHRVGDVWRQQAYVKASNTDADDQLGASSESDSNEG